MPLTPRTYRLLAQILQLRRRHLEITKVLPGKDERGLEIVLVLNRFGEVLGGLLRALDRTGGGVVDDRVYGGDALCDVEADRVGGEGDGDAVEEVVAEFALVGVEDGDEEEATGVAEGYSFTFYHDESVVDDVEEDIGGFFVQEVDVVDVEDSAVGFGEESG